MKGFVDIHCHLLPHIDDGAETIQEAVKMIGIAYKNGIRTMIVTPHFHAGRYKTSKEDIHKQFVQMKKIIRTAGVKMRLCQGQEIYYQQETAELLDKGSLYTMAGSKYVLIEFSTTAAFYEILFAFQTLLMSGYIPILAHAERYDCLVKDSALVQELINAGAYIQINAGSILNGAYSIKRFIKKLMKQRMVHFIATDAHGTVQRTPELQKAYRYILKKYGEDYAQEVLTENPERIIRNEYI